METTNLLNENVLTVMQRRQRAINTKRRQPQLKRARQIAARKLAPEETLMRRARRKAKDILRAKFAGKRGADYHTLPPADRVQVDKLIEKKLPAIEKLVKRLLPQVRADERKRLKKRNQAKRAGAAATTLTKSLVSNKIPLKEMVDGTFDVLVEHYTNVVSESDFNSFELPEQVVEGIAADAFVTSERQLKEILENTTTNYQIVEGLDLKPIGGQLAGKKTVYITFYHPDKLHYHVERIAATDDYMDEPVVQGRLSQGYIVVDDTIDARNKYFNRRFRTRVDD